MIKKSILGLGLFGIVGTGVAGIAHAVPDGAVAPIRLAATDTAQSSTVSAVGVVQQTRPEQGKVKISHEAIPALDWPPMTMFFRVKDKAVLEGIAAGDKVRFELEKGATGLEITRMEKMAK
ncbi:copper-binding protein [Thiobacillus sp.]|jgi:Cu(I)/Ag(I) efflux system protein CusF|uniref:copper-binding protein n=1 Tax=Thiobacillus sp. TaxID=924 RepID=UPI001AC88A1D|nr:copper-binding protein [Thiobacillus sp.]MBN8781226.1 copper-binding protein [Thiobacillus sp.]